MYTSTYEPLRTREYAHARNVSLFVSIVTGAMIYRRATMCVEVSTERDERLLTIYIYTRRSNAVDLVEKRRAFFLGDSFIEVSIGSYNNYLSRIRGDYPSAPPAYARAPLSSIRLDSTNIGAAQERGETSDEGGNGRGPDSCSIRRVLRSGRVN